MRSPRLAPPAALLLAALLAGCTSADADTADDQAAEDVDATEEDGDGPVIVQPGAPGEPSRVLDPDEVPEVAAQEHTEADVAFMQGMIPHHVQALRMTRLVPDRSARDDIPLFAERMDISQEGEIELIQNWLETRDEEVPSLTADHDHGDGDPMGGANDGELMPGMLTEEELLELEAADGEEFDRMFVEAMIRHHQGAIAMVEQLFAEGGGSEAEIFQFANHVQSDQSIEINRMEDMLADMDA
jgi:uncharacterized protein (DUF305 family)